MTTMKTGTKVNFSFNLPYVGHRHGAGRISGPGQFSILGETYTVISDGSGSYAKGEAVEVKRVSIK